MNFTALPARLSSTWRRRIGSPTTCAGMAGSRCSDRSRPLPRACGVSRSTTAWLSPRRQKGSSASSMRPASTFCRSRMSLMISTSAAADPLTTSMSSRCSGSSGVVCSRSIVASTPCMGVRISCDIEARNCDLASDAAIASSRARASASSYCTREVTSRNIHSAPRSRPSSTIGWKSNSSTRPSASSIGSATAGQRRIRRSSVRRRNAAGSSALCTRCDTAALAGRPASVDGRTAARKSPHRVSLTMTTRRCASSTSTPACMWVSSVVSRDIVSRSSSSAAFAVVTSSMKPIRLPTGSSSSRTTLSTARVQTVRPSAVSSRNSWSKGESSRSARRCASHTSARSSGCRIEKKKPGCSIQSRTG